MAIRNLVTSSGIENYNLSNLNYSLEDEIDCDESIRMLMVSAESEIDSAEHAANAADAMSGVLEVAESNGGEVTENEASLIDDVNTAVSGSSTSDDPPVSISSESNGRYYISTEAILDKIKEIWEKIKATLLRAWDFIKNIYKKFFDSFDATRTRTLIFLTKLNEISDSLKTSKDKLNIPASFEITSDIKMLFLGDKVIDNKDTLISGIACCSNELREKRISAIIKNADD